MALLLSSAMNLAPLQMQIDVGQFAAMGTTDGILSRPVGRTSACNQAFQMSMVKAVNSSACMPHVCLVNGDGQEKVWAVACFCLELLQHTLLAVRVRVVVSGVRVSVGVEGCGHWLYKPPPTSQHTPTELPKLLRD